MELSLKQLPNHLKHSIKSIYLISGDVPLLVQEARDAIRQAAKIAGFQQRELLNIEPGFNWSQFTSLTQNFNLFSKHCLIEINNPNTKFDEHATQALTMYLQNPSHDHVIVIATGKLTTAQKKTHWYKCIKMTGVVILIWPINAHELPQWIKARCLQKGINANTDSIIMLAEATEGNLLATQQALEKLQLLFPSQSITCKEMAAVITDNTHFNVFDLVNYVLAGKSQHVIRVMRSLNNKGTEPALVLWALLRELRQLSHMVQQLQQNISIQQILQKEWPSRKPLLKAALSRLNMTTLNDLLLLAARTDQIIKGIIPGNPWETLLQLCLQLAGLDLNLEGN